MRDYNFCDKRTFLARIAEVIVAFKGKDSVYNWHKLLSAESLNYLITNGLDNHFGGACIPDISFPEYGVYEKGWRVPAEFIIEFIENRRR
jgi:hypothetical protein